MAHKILAVVGIRPDFIRMSVVLRKLDAREDVDLVIVHTGQHYDNELSGVFFEELDIPKPEYTLKTADARHSKQHAKLIDQLDDVIEKEKPDVCIFLGDANATIGCVAALKNDIPIVHIEGGMRSHDWSMPEEKNRVLIDSVSDLIFVYQADYKISLVREGVDPDSIVVCGNTITEVLSEWAVGFSKQKEEGGLSKYYPNGDVEYFERLGPFALMTLHRDAAMKSAFDAQRAVTQAGMFCSNNGLKLVIVSMPRFKKFNLVMPDCAEVIEPQSNSVFTHLLVRSNMVFTDSGTNQEVAAIMGRPCVVVRKSTERPECGLTGINVLADIDDICKAAESIYRKQPLDIKFGGEYASEIIVGELVARMNAGYFQMEPYLDNFQAKHFVKFQG